MRVRSVLLSLLLAAILARGYEFASLKSPALTVGNEKQLFVDQTRDTREIF